jgi:hypothetical protein
MKEEFRSQKSEFWEEVEKTGERKADFINFCTLLFVSLLTPDSWILTSELRCD